MLDSSALAYMANQPSLFRGLQKVIAKRYIKVSGGFLQLVKVGIVILEDRCRNKYLVSLVLYMPNLRVNLISRQKLCLDYTLLRIILPTSFLLVYRLYQVLLTCIALTGVYVIDEVKE